MIRKVMLMNLRRHLPKMHRKFRRKPHVALERNAAAGYRNI
jgi:hypothetical protein